MASAIDEPAALGSTRDRELIAALRGRLGAARLRVVHALARAHLARRRARCERAGSAIAAAHAAAESEKIPAARPARPGWPARRGSRALRTVLVAARSA